MSAGLRGRDALRLWLPVLLVLCCFALTSAQNASAARVAQVERYSGEGQIGTEPAFPVHLEIRRSGDRVEGVISSPGADFRLVDASGTAVVSGKISGDAGNGTIRVEFTGHTVEGRFELEGQSGTLRATRTSQDAATFFKGPQQNLDLTKNQWRQDLDRLVEILTTHHGSPFHRISRVTFNREVERVRAKIPRLGNAEIAVELSRLGAMIGDGHTWVALPSGQPRFNLEAFWFEDGVRVVAIDPSNADLLGAKLVAVDDVPVTELVRRLRAFAAQGETEWSYRAVAPYLLTRPDVLKAVGVGAGASRWFTFQTTDGRTRRVELHSALERAERVTHGGSPPLWDRGSEAFATQRLAEGSVYVNWRSYDKLAENSRALLAELDRTRPRRLIIDLRDNGGGDYNHGRSFIEQLVARDWLNRADRLFVLTGRQTFSAAMTNAVDFRKMTRATLIGEPPGAAPNNWQEVRRFHLPNSGLAVGVSTKYYEFLPGEQAVRPDLDIPPTPGDWGADYDAAVRYVLALPCPGK